MLARRLRPVKGAQAVYGFLTIPSQAGRHTILAVQFKSTFAKPTASPSAVGFFHAEVVADDVLWVACQPARKPLQILPPNAVTELRVDMPRRRVVGGRHLDHLTFRYCQNQR